MLWLHARTFLAWLRTARRDSPLLIFVLAALPKFAAFGWERGNFERFGLPAPGAWVVAAGVVELVGGVALLKDRWVAPAAVLLAITMGVAIVASGVLQGDVVPSLTVAPVLLAALVVLLVREARSS